MPKLADLLAGLPAELREQVFRHASWTERRSEAYDRLAFLGDSVLGLAVTTHLFPRLDADEYGAGELTKVRAQAVSGRACRRVAEQLDVPAHLRRAAPTETSAEPLIGTERVLASVCEAVIGACYLQHGYETTAEAVVEAFADEIEQALETPLDFKSALQELLARRAQVVSYSVVGEEGPPHQRTFAIAACVGADELGRGSGRSKKDAEQAAAEAALTSLREAG